MIEIRGVAKSFAAPGPPRGAAWWRRASPEASVAGAAPGVDAGEPADGRGHGLRVHAVRDVSLDAPDGRITALLGPNGAGKTTTLRMLAALIAPDAGTLRVDGIDVVARPREVLARTGFLSDSRGLYPRLTARENIAYYGALHGLERDAADARAQDLARMFDMTGLLDRRAAGFSQGERMKTALARALVHDPANIVLDEPTNGLDVLATRALRESLRWLRTAEGGSKCIVFSTHIMQEVERLCDGVVVVARGRTIANGTVAELLAATGERDFEEAFVKLAFGAELAPGREDPARADRRLAAGARR
jgi:sodium transport system ATP-binding protein